MQQPGNDVCCHRQMGRSFPTNNHPRIPKVKPSSEKQLTGNHGCCLCVKAMMRLWVHRAINASPIPCQNCRAQDQCFCFEILSSINLSRQHIPEHPHWHPQSGFITRWGKKLPKTRNWGSIQEGPSEIENALRYPMCYRDTAASSSPLLMWGEEGSFTTVTCKLAGLRSDAVIQREHE